MQLCHRPLHFLISSMSAFYALNVHFSLPMSAFAVSMFTFTITDVFLIQLQIQLSYNQPFNYYHSFLPIPTLSDTVLQSFFLFFSTFFMLTFSKVFIFSRYRWIIPVSLLLSPFNPFWSYIFIFTLNHSLNIFSYFLCNSIVFSFIYKLFYKTNFLFFSLPIFFSASRFFSFLTFPSSRASRVILFSSAFSYKVIRISPSLSSNFSDSLSLM